MKPGLPWPLVLPLQIGTFYEAVGGDAALLVEYCRVNPMSKGSGIPRAGLPLCKLRRSLVQLVLDRQLSVVRAFGGRA